MGYPQNLQINCLFTVALNTGWREERGMTGDREDRGKGNGNQPLSADKTPDISLHRHPGLETTCVTR